MTQSFLDRIGIERMQELALEASDEAIAEAHAHGLPVTLGKPDGTIYDLYPDGHEEIIEVAPSSTQALAVNM